MSENYKIKFFEFIIASALDLSSVATRITILPSALVCFSKGIDALFKAFICSSVAEK